MSNSERSNIQTTDLIKNLYREDTVNYLINCIINLEIKQLSENVISVVEKRKVYNPNRIKKIGRVPSTDVAYEYELQFDVQSQTPNITVSSDLLTKMNKFREESIVYVAHDKAFSTKSERFMPSRFKRKSRSPLIDKKSPHKSKSISHFQLNRLKNANSGTLSKNEDIKQLVDLTDAKII
jgi:hypothetical protein